MAGMFGGKTKMPPPPKPVRQPVETDPAVRDAALRTRFAARNRQGRLATMLTDNASVGDLIGSSGGERLGA
jgi:hypothetical protein